MSVTLLLAVAGCVSPVDDMVDANQSFAPGAASMTVASVADGPQFHAASGSSAELAAETAIDDVAEAPDAENIPAVDVVPEPAPRDVADNPRLMEGTALAFAREDDARADTEIRTGSIAPDTADGQTAGQTPNQTQAPNEAVPTQTKATAEDQPKTLFDFLRQRWQSKQTQSRQTQPNAVRLASLGPTGSASAEPAVATAGESAENGAMPLPGVSKNGSLFEVGDDDHESEEGETIEVASVGALARLSPLGLHLQTERVDVACLKPGLVKILKIAEKHFGHPVVVTSGYRSAKTNRRAGGARKSLHMQCMAADVQIEGVSKWDLAAYLRTVPGRGGVGTYCRTRSVHIDIGEERAWHYPCRRVKRNS